MKMGRGRWVPVGVVAKVQPEYLNQEEKHYTRQLKLPYRRWVEQPSIV
jgi:hypothetical protein